MEWKDRKKQQRKSVTIQSEETDQGYWWKQCDSKDAETESGNTNNIVHSKITKKIYQQVGEGAQGQIKEECKGNKAILEYDMGTERTWQKGQMNKEQ